MDYLKKLENSVENFEAEISKLTRIDKLITDTETLLDAVADEKVLLKNSVVQLENLREQIEKDCATLAEFTKNESAARQKLLDDIHKNILADSKIIIENLAAPLGNSATQIEIAVEENKKAQEKFFASVEKDCATLAEFAANEEAARQKLLADIHKNILADSKVIIEDLAAPLDNSRSQLAETCELLKKLIEVHQKSQENFLASIETILIKYNTKNLEVYNNITGTLSNKFELAENNISTNLNLKFNNIAQDFSNLNTQLEKNSKELSAEIGGIAEEFKSLKETLATIKTAAFIAVGTGAAACIVHFIK